MGEQVPYVLNLNGGLDLVSPHYVLQQNPGTARIMINYEPSVSAGYRRINGWTQFGSATPTGGTDTILGVFPYADGVVAIAGSGIYFSTDGDTWMQVNRDTYTQQSTGTLTIDGSVNVTKGTEAADLTTLYSLGEDIRISGEIRNIVGITADTITVDQAFTTSTSAIHYKNGTDTLSGTILARVGQGRAMFAWYEEDGEYGSLVWSDENGNYDLGYFKITGTGAGRVYQYDVLDSANFGAPSKPKYITQFDERIVVANDAASTGNVAWSDRLNNRRFTGASSGTLQVDHPVLAVRGLRDRVVVFCRNSIHQLVELDDPNQLNTAILPVTYKVGCASGWTVQEIGGDLIFLAPDGIRTLKAADSYGDVQFGNVARKIDPIIKEILANLNSTTFSSVTLRNKNQYRLFYTRTTFFDAEQPALIGTLKADNTGEVVWQWSKIEGMPVSAIDGVASVSDLSLNLEKHIQGMTDGKIGFHDEGNSFNGADVQARLELNELDYGDIGRRKTLHYVRIFGDVESPTVDDITMNVVYDYSDDNTAQPPAYPLAGVGGVAGYGTAIYDTDVYGGPADFSERVLIEGSGYSNKFKFDSLGPNGPYSINSLYIDMRIGPQL
jgi:hypothetical protein